MCVYAIYARETYRIEHAAEQHHPRRVARRWRRRRQRVVATQPECWGDKHKNATLYGGRTRNACLRTALLNCFKLILCREHSEAPWHTSFRYLFKQMRRDRTHVHTI